MRINHFLESQTCYPTANPPLQSHQHSLMIAQYIVVFFIFGLLSGGILKQISRVTKLPYTPMLLMIGLIIGYFRNSLAFLGSATSMLSQINPHVMLLVFIPVLIFQSAYNCAWHVFRKSLWNIITLACPGVLLGSLLIGVTFKVILGYSDEQMSWYQAMVIGAVLSATDPVAVVSLLKQLGASTRFNTLVQGQSLLNDGTAMVFLNIFMQLAAGEQKGIGQSLVQFVRTSLGGPILGFLIGFIISWWLKFVIDDTVLAITITFIGAYSSFYIAQYTILKVSGILSVVFLGLYMSSVGKHKINPESTESLHQVWGFIQYICETLIFIITGVIVGVKIINQSTIQFADWVKMIIFWFLMIAIRAIMVLTFYPILNNTGYGLKRRQMIVLIYGGLRGALGLCLALTVNFNDKLSERFRNLTIFYMCGMAVLTIIINGLTCGKVVNYVQMIVYPQSKQKLFLECAKQVMDSASKKMNSLKNQPSMVYADWRQVQNLAQIGTLGDIHYDSELKKQVQGIKQQLQNMNRDGVRSEIRFRFGRNLRKVLIDAYQKGEISQNSFNRLKQNCQIVNDNTNEEFQYFQLLQRNFQTQVAAFTMKFQNWPILDNLVAMYVPNKLQGIYQMTTTFIWAAEEAIHQFQDTFPLKSYEVHQVMKQVRGDMEKAVNYIVQLQQNFPTVIRAVHTIKASNTLLNYKKHKLNSMYNQGFLDQGQYNQLKYEIDKKIIKSQYHRYQLEQVIFNELLPQYRIFSKLPSHQINKIRNNSVQKIYAKGTKLLQKNSLMKSIFFLVSGSIQEQFQQQQIFLMKGPGSFINPYDFTFQQKSKACIKALSNTKVIEIPSNIIFGFLNKYDDFCQKWFKNIFPYCLNFAHSTNTIEQFFTARFLRDFIEDSAVIKLTEKNKMKMENGGYMFQGEVQKYDKYNHHSKQKRQIEGIEKYMYIKGDFIQKGDQIIALKNSIVMKFSKNLEVSKHHHFIM